MINYHIRRCIAFAGFMLFTLCIAMYLPCNMYDFAAPQKFHGAYLYNPYADTLPDWKKANFHAHAFSWKGITNGKQSAQTIIKAYRQKKYDYACISNYEKLAKTDGAPGSVYVYEHGYNLRKIHHLVIMPAKVCYSDFPLWQCLSAKQFNINKLSTCAKAVALPHPMLKNSYTDEDLKKLSGYNLIEVLNHSVNSSEKWDVALSAGKAAWIIGDDDTHDITDRHQTFTNWTMIDCHQPYKDSLVNNLINGNAYGVCGKNAFNDNRLLAVKTHGMQVSWQLQNKADSIKLTGQNGIVKKVAVNVSDISYTFLSSDTYIRATVYNKQSKMYLNPVMRYDGKLKPQNLLTATINPFKTLLYRCCLVVCWLLAFLLLNRAGVIQILKRLNNRLSQNKKKPGFILE